jgi:hypothetical protein
MNTLIMAETHFHHQHAGTLRDAPRFGNRHPPAESTMVNPPAAYTVNPSMRASAAPGRSPRHSHELLLLLLLLLLPSRTARRHAHVHSGRKSAHEAQGAYSRRRWFVCPDGP